MKWMSSLVSYTFINIFTCWYKFPHMETKQKTHENVEMLMRMWKCAQLCNSHVKTYISWYGNKTEKTQNLVKCMSSHVNCRFPNVDLTSHMSKQNREHVKTCGNVHKCATHMWRHTFPDVETKQRSQENTWNECLHLWVAHFRTFSHVY